MTTFFLRTRHPRNKSLDKIRQYILNNPKQWKLDEKNPKNIKKSIWK